MFLININHILYVWTMNYDILFIPDIGKFYLRNLDKDNFVYMTYRNNVFIRYIRKYLCLYCIRIFFLYIM